LEDSTYNFNQGDISLYSLCQDSLTRPCKITVFKFNYSGDHVIIGEGLFKVEMIINKEKNIKIIKPITNEIRGEIIILKAEIQERFTFLDYIFGGVEISLSVAIDFTLSNLDPKEKDSLHCFDLTKNQYYKAISSIGHILENYDSTKKITLLGFGAKIPGAISHRASNCFSLNGDIFNPQVDGITGVMECYKKAIKKIHFHGPTYFAEIIRYISAMAEYEIKNLK